MALAELYSGTEAVSTTEWSCVNDSFTIAAITTDGIFQLWLDVSDMVAGDDLQIRLYEKVRSAATQRVVEEWRLSGVQTRPIWVSPAIILLHGWDWTLDAIAGTITVNWSIRQVG